MSLSLILVFIGVLSLTFFLCLPLENPFEALRCNSIADVERHDWRDEVLSQQSLPLAGLLIGESESVEQAHFAVDKVALFVLPHQLHSRFAVWHIRATAAYVRRLVDEESCFPLIIFEFIKFDVVMRQHFLGNFHFLEWPECDGVAVTDHVPSFAQFAMILDAIDFSPVPFS